MKKQGQVERTKKLITEALLQLIEEKPYKKITVTDIVSLAGYARKTFYAHFETKDDILAEYMDRLFELHLYEPHKDLEAFPPALQGDKFMLGLINLWRDNANFFQLINESGLKELLFKVYLSNIDKVQTKVINPVIALDPQNIPMDYFYVFLVNAHIGILQHWVEKDMRLSPEEIVRILRILAGPSSLVNFKEEFENNPIKK
jgi:AcrR family transcriptional regulator